MRSKEELFREARRQVSLRRQRSATLAAQQSKEAHNAIPELRQVEGDISRLGFEAARLAASGASREEYTRLLEQSREARQRRRALLAAHGWAAEQLEPKPVCALCGDTGVCNGRVCRCVTDLCRSLRRQEILEESALSISSFDTLKLQYYPATYDPDLGTDVRQYMGDILESLRQYAVTFDMRSSNLLIAGNAGLGKTHAALAIAGIVLDKGYDVIYTSAESLFGHLEKARFDEDDTLMDAVLEADLLILDDLGTEYASSYMLSCFYTILNTRLGCKKPTIYTTNIVDGTLFEKRYTEKIASRLGGSCEAVEFRGEDIRHLKKLEQDAY